MNLSLSSFYKFNFYIYSFIHFFIFEKELSTLKKSVPEIVGTKLGFMVVRYEKEGVYMYI